MEIELKNTKTALELITISMKMLNEYSDGVFQLYGNLKQPISLLKVK